MKQVKLLILLILILSLSVFAFACGKSEEPADNGGAAQEEVKHELHDYLVLKEESKAHDFSEVSQYEGEIVDYDREHSLLALKTQDLDVKNQVTDIITIYDILTGEKLQTHTATYPLEMPEADKIELEVEISYPIVRVSKTSQSEIEEGEYKEVYDVKYYFAKKNSELVRSSDSDEYERYDYGNGLVAFKMGDEIVWIDRYMKEVRSVKSVAANGYDISGYVFKSEYQGYLYAYDEKSVQIFNRNGECSGTYTMKNDGYLNVHVLDSGKVLVQEIEYVYADEIYDCIINDGHDGKIQRVRVHSYIMDYLDGKVTKVELNYVVSYLETAYTERYDDNNGHGYMPFKLAEGRDNQALIYRFSAGKLSLYQEYVVMNNELQIEYTVNNTAPGVYMQTATPISNDAYAAYVVEGGTRQMYIFDLDGNKISPVSANYISKTKNYIITDNGVYDNKMKMLYDFNASEFAGGEWYVDEAAERIYLTKYNFVTASRECYLLDVVKKQTTLICDGTRQVFFDAGEGFYILQDVETEKLSFYDLKDEVKLIAYDYQGSDRSGDVVVVGAVFEGKPVTYVVK